MNRHDLLISFAVAAACVGLRAQEPAAAPELEGLDAAFAEAQRLAAQHKAPVLAFVLPPVTERADRAAARRTRDLERRRGLLVTRGGEGAPKMATARQVLLRQLQLLRVPDAGRRFEARTPGPAQLVLALTVPVVAPARLCGAKPGEDVVLLSPRGERVAGWALDLLDEQAFVAAVGAHVLDEDALAPRRANVQPEALEALARVEAARAEAEAGLAEQGGGQLPDWDFERLYAPLAHRLVALAPALVRREHGGHVAGPELAAMEGARAPLGTAVDHLLGDPCPGCGMGYTPPNLSTVLRLIGP